MLDKLIGIEQRYEEINRQMLEVGDDYQRAAELNKERIDLEQFERPYIVDSSKFERTFGMQPTPMREAVHETVAWFKSHPQRK